MRTGPEKSYRPRLDTLEDRLPPALSRVPAPVLLPPAVLLDSPQVLPPATPPGVQSEGHCGSLVAAVMTEAYPTPHALDQPGLPGVRPFHLDPTGFPTVAAWTTTY